MLPNQNSVAMALAKWFERKAVVQQANGPYATDGGGTQLRVHFNDGTILSIDISVYKHPVT